MRNVGFKLSCALIFIFSLSISTEVSAQTCDLPDDGIAFGSDFNETHRIQGNKIPIYLRSTMKVHGFSFGIQISEDTLTFKDRTLGPDDERLFENIISRDDGKPLSFEGNQATGLGDAAITKVEKAATLLEIQGDFLAVDIAPQMGGSGITVGYLVDLVQAGNVIPATDDEACEAHHILDISLDTVFVGKEIRRGDCNGDGSVNINDAIVCVRNLFLGTNKFFDCNAMLDVNGDNLLTTADPIVILVWLFLEGAPPADPFRACGPFESELGCNESNCI